MEMTVNLAVAALLVAALGTAASDQPAKDWPMHDESRPQPPVVDPGPPPERPRPAPSDAMVLFDGKDLAKWRATKDGGPAKWKVENGHMEVVAGHGRHPHRPAASATASSTWSGPRPRPEWRGGPAPREQRHLPDGTLRAPGAGLPREPDVSRRAGGGALRAVPAAGQRLARRRASGRPTTSSSARPRFDAAGKLLAPARMTVFHNGVLVQDDRDAARAHGAQARPPYEAHAAKLPLGLQDHGLPGALPQHLDARAGRTRRLAAAGRGVMQISPPKEYDVCIVGSGAGGGMAAKVLAEGGADVRAAGGGAHVGRGQGRRDVRRGPTTRRGAAPARGSGRSASSTAASAAGTSRASPTRWPRASASSGSARACWAAAPTTGAASRCASGPGTSRAAAATALGDDWPIGYDDIKPYYDKLDRMVGLFGSKENLPNEPDGIFQPPPAPRAYERLVKKACDELRITCIPSRLSSSRGR